MFREKALELHRKNKGKICIKGKVEIHNMEDLSLAYSPGVAEPCKEIEKNTENIYEYTGKGNAVAVVTNGSAVLGLGDIGAKASLPVMEGKCLLFKNLAGIDAYPLILDSTSIEDIINVVKIVSPGFGGINLEDIKAPECFEIENTLRRELDIPVFHDDQHGTAIIVLAGLLNAAKLAGKNLKECKIVVNGAGSAGTAVTNLLLSFGVEEIKVCDLRGILYPGSKQCLYNERKKLARNTNPDKKKGNLSDVLSGADIFIGLSAPNVLDAETVRMMSKDPIIMALANPEPEIMPEEAERGGASIIFTGRSDFPNQINNVSAFPGVFRGALDIRADQINEEMKIAAAYAIAGLIPPEELNKENVIPSALDPRVVPTVARAAAKAAIESGAAYLDVDPDEVYRNAEKLNSLR